MSEAKKRVVAEHDGLLTICTGSSRRSKAWKPKRMAWSQLVQRLGTTKRTAETQKEYLKMDKAQQDAIKDVGGFVGGELKEGRRTALTVENRQVVTLDADYADASLWDMVETGVAFEGHSICAYSTHKHTPERPRLRLVIPLDRPVSPDEYQAISRKIAEEFGIDSFDDSTYQPHRLMYWPSTSIDGEFFFRWQDGPWLSADGVLSEYDDWQDQTTWPVSSRMDTQVRRAMKKQQDPHEKKGLLGTFCRAYTIADAIETFLPGVYEECGKEHGRYTFTAGTSSGGALTYEDKWLYSFHSTDPCSCQLVNAFDLVRIHKFADLDEGKNGQDVTKLPSYEAMMQLASEDDRVKVLQMKERMQEARDEFEDLGPDGDLEKQDFDWTKRLKIDTKGKILATRANIRTILKNDPCVKETFGWDAFSMRISILREPSWREGGEHGVYWEDGDDSELRYFFETYYGIDSKQKLEDETLNVAMKNSFHKVQDYLNSLVWDGKERMESIFIDYLGAEDTPYIRTVTRKMLIGAVGRVMRPGLKFDNVVVLQGRQGIGKSYLLKKLGKEWFSDSFNTVQGKEAYEQLRGCWIVEIGELTAFKRSEEEAIKQFISKQVDTYRVAYGKRPQEFPRQCIFVGTTNKETFLRDRTGNRRFWPVRVGIGEPVKGLWAPGIDEEIDQIWAETLKYWKDGEDTWIGSLMEQTAEQVQERHMEDNPLAGAVRSYLDKEVPANWYKLSIQDRRDFLSGRSIDSDMEGAFVRNRICPVEIWCEMMEGDIKRFGTYDRKEIREILETMEGWELYNDGRSKLSFGQPYGQQRTYVRKGADDVVNPVGKPI